MLFESSFCFVWGGGIKTKYRTWKGLLQKLDRLAKQTGKSGKPPTQKPQPRATETMNGGPSSSKLKKKIGGISETRQDSNLKMCVLSLISSSLSLSYYYFLYFWGTAHIYSFPSLRIKYGSFFVHVCVCVCVCVIPCFLNDLKHWCPSRRVFF